MTKFTPAQREDIERIKQEYYCGTAKAMQMYFALSENRQFADQLNLLDGTDWTWQEALCFRYLGVHEDGTEASVEEIASAMEKLDTSELFDRLSYAKSHNEIFNVERGTRAFVPAFYHQNLINPSSVPVHMRSPEADTLYLRMREEDTLHQPDLQRLFLVRTAMAENARSVDTLRGNFQRRYDEAQHGDTSITFFIAHDIITEAAAYGLGLLARSDIRGWLNNYFKR